jgi:uncharacterized membrane protein YfhO
MNLTILKLRSGEEIACQILEETESNIKVFQPMVFKTISSLDSTGRPFDITTLQDWLVNTDDKNVLIPQDHIAFKSVPNDDTLELYKMESYQFDKSIMKTDVKEDIKLNDNTLSNDVFATFLEDLINSSMNSKNSYSDSPKKRSKKSKKKQKDYLPPDMQDETELDRHMIMMQLYIPAESIMNMITSGVIKPQVLLDMIEEVKKRNRFTGDEKDRKDFGEKFSDWNPDPNSEDYK